MEPEVRYFLLCDQVRTDPNNFHRIDALGLITSIRSTATPPFPVVRPILCALIAMEAGPGAGELALRIMHEKTGRIIFRSLPRQVRFVGDAQAVRAAVFRIRGCSFPMSGVYWIEAIFAGSVIARQKLRLTT
jgi:hypothetical protein